MKRYIHDGIGLRVMRGPENEIGLGLVVVSELTCDCGFHVCQRECPGIPYPDLLEGWALGLGGYYHPSGAEVQRRGERWAWFRAGMDTCDMSAYQNTALEAMALADPGWRWIESWSGQLVYMHGAHIVYAAGDFWHHNQDDDGTYLTAEAAMKAALLGG